MVKDLSKVIFLWSCKRWLCEIFWFDDSKW